MAAKSSHIEYDDEGTIVGPGISLPGHPGTSFPGEVAVLLDDLELLLANYEVTDDEDEGLRHIVNVALGVGFDYGVEYGRSGVAAADEKAEV